MTLLLSTIKLVDILEILVIVEFSPLAIDDKVFGRIMQSYVITSCLLSTGVSSALLTILGMPDREKRWKERRSYFIMDLRCY